MGLNLDLEDKKLPLDTQLEISLLGAGAGYGESIVIHLGYNNWIIVDSCVNPTTKECLPLEYLLSRDVNIKENVKLILCTHWHDDHIKGISKLLSACENSIFSMSACTDQKKFLQFVELDYIKAKNDPSHSSTKEIKSCFEILKKNNKPIKKALQDRLLLNIENNSINAKIYSLSPSDHMIESFDREIANLFNQYNQDVKVTIESENNKSVALLLNINGHCVLLGSDLEVSSNTEKGWICILDKSQCLNTKSSLFKIPHHGSRTGYHERIWDELLTQDTTSILTPYNRGGKTLPEIDMLKKYIEHSDYLYITSDIAISRSPKKRDNHITKMINQFNNTLKELKYNFGIVKCTLDFTNKNSKWDIQLIENAKQITLESLNISSHVSI